ncbi:unnamed protein product [Brassicogethes aeneus]|uniref:UDP-N-acetylglucosamine transferase subunit ALG13 n=1 Tax=Brassicogethes aeneus TaxID=1431903 RepID=A0A9P0FEL0_BRAAE|nr:unnamed protein product [Brassicogethes aeneus]
MGSKKLNINNVFVTVGTTKFKKLIETILCPEIIDILIQLEVKKVILQVGNDWSIGHNCSKYINYQITVEEEESKITYTNPCGGEIVFECVKYLENFLETIQQNDLIISHAGAGTCLEVLNQNKPLIVVINEDLMNNHQTELAKQLEADELAFCSNCDTLKNVLKDIKPRKPYIVGDKNVFGKYLDQCMGFV